jgi:hypothetical protein
VDQDRVEEKSFIKEASEELRRSCCEYYTNDKGNALAQICRFRDQVVEITLLAKAK